MERNTIQYLILLRSVRARYDLLIYKIQNFLYIYILYILNQLILNKYTFFGKESVKTICG